MDVIQIAADNDTLELEASGAERGAMPVDSSHKMPVVHPKFRSLAEAGLDESWLEKWICEDPKRLSLGKNLRVVKSQIFRPSSSGGGRLDLQVVDDDIEDRVYEVELMRGELDSDHGFRTLDYWAKEMENDDSDRDHRPVIVAERLRTSRYWSLLKVLSEKLGLIGIEIRCAVVEDNAAIWLEPTLLPEDLETTRSGEIGTARASLTEADWRAKTTDDFQSFLGQLMESAVSLGLVHDVRWTAKSYVGLWKNNRCWCPIWPRKEAGGRVYLPAPRNWAAGDEDTVPPEFDALKESLLKVGVQAVWTWTYNMGSNPIAVTIRLPDLSQAAVKDLLRESWSAL